jgi:hypothetical protein
VSKHIGATINKIQSNVSEPHQIRAPTGRTYHEPLPQTAPLSSLSMLQQPPKKDPIRPTSTHTVVSVQQAARTWFAASQYVLHISERRQSTRPHRSQGSRATCACTLVCAQSLLWPHTNNSTSACGHWPSVPPNTGFTRLDSSAITVPLQHSHFQHAAPHTQRHVANIGPGHTGPSRQGLMGCAPWDWAGCWPCAHCPNLTQLVSYRGLERSQSNIN